jgi:predicted TIM-barrel fold metal-dependent hydrolase
LGFPSPYTGAWDELFATAEEAGAPLMVHLGTGGPSDPGRAPGANLTLTTIDCLQAVTDFVFSGALLHHRSLHVVAVEAGAAWLPHVAERMDFFLRRPGVWPADGIRPSELLRAQVSVSFIDDPVAIRWRHDVGVDRMLWQSDFPHRDSFWPDSRAVLARLLEDVPGHEANAIAEGNARRLLCIPTR